MAKNGFIYSLYSMDQKPNKFYDEFLVSYKSLKKVLPKSNVSLYTNIIFENNIGIDQVIFDKEINKSHIAKAFALLNSPYEKTIFLDTDTFIHRKTINDIFKVLDEFDFTCNFACSGANTDPYDGEIFPELNTGLLGVKNNAFTKSQMEVWINNFASEAAKYKEKGFPKGDQISFRNHIFMKNKNKFYILPTYYQFRFHIYKAFLKKAVLSHDHDILQEKNIKEHILTKIISFWIKSL